MVKMFSNLLDHLANSNISFNCKRLHTEVLIANSNFFFSHYFNLTYLVQL
jgi:hypothetical protein